MPDSWKKKKKSGKKKKAEWYDARKQARKEARKQARKTLKKLQGLAAASSDSSSTAASSSSSATANPSSVKRRLKAALQQATAVCDQWVAKQQRVQQHVQDELERALEGFGSSSSTGGPSLATLLANAFEATSKNKGPGQQRQLMPLAPGLKWVPRPQPGFILPHDPAASMRLFQQEQLQLPQQAQPVTLPPFFFAPAPTTPPGAVQQAQAAKGEEATFPWRGARTKAGYRKEPITCWHCRRPTYWGKKWRTNKRCKSNQKP